MIYRNCKCIFIVYIIFSHIISFALDFSFLVPPSMQELSTHPLEGDLHNAHQDKKELPKTALPAQFDVSDEGEYQYLKLALERVFNMFPDIFRDKLIKRLKQFSFPNSQIPPSHGTAYLDGSIKIGVILDPLYFIEISLHEIGHLFQKELAEHPDIHIDGLALGGHIYINGLLLYLLYPAELQQLVHQRKSWLAVRNYWKGMMGGREFSNEEARLLLAFINEQKENVINLVKGYSAVVREFKNLKLKTEQMCYKGNYGAWNEKNIDKRDIDSAKLLKQAN